MPHNLRLLLLIAFAALSFFPVDAALAQRKKAPGAGHGMTCIYGRVSCGPTLFCLSTEMKAFGLEILPVGV
jgi:hypothetical protein